MKTLTTKTAKDPRRASAQDIARFEAKLKGDAALERAREIAARKAAEMIGDAALIQAREIAARKAAQKASKKNTAKR